MSKMPAKKKSCFQITSVTTAQATASIAEDSESLDGDPEDASSEFNDAARGPEEGGAGRSSSEETLNSPGSASPNPLQQPPATCSSRFRVIKLDHGSGEPYRRGRWTCVDFYDREPDSFRHGSIAEQGADRDSGLGGSHPGPEPTLDNTPPQHLLSGQQPVHPATAPPGQHSALQAQVQLHNGNGQQANQSQHLYPQVPAGQVHATQPGSQAEYMQGAAPGSAAPSLPLCQVAALLSAGGALGPLNSDSAVQGTGHAHAGQANNHPAVMQQKPVTQHQPGGSGQVLGPQPMVYGVPAVPSTHAATPITMPNVSGTVVQSQQSSHTTVTRSTSLVQPIGLPVQGIAHSNLPQSALGHFQTLGQIDDRRKSEPLPQPPLSLIAEHKHSMKPPILDTLTNPHLPVTTPMNTLTSSVFGITIPVDGDDDRSVDAFLWCHGRTRGISSTIPHLLSIMLDRLLDISHCFLNSSCEIQQTSH